MTGKHSALTVKRVAMAHFRCGAEAKDFSWELETSASGNIIGKRLWY